MHHTLRSIFALSSLLILICATPAFAAIELDPGQWQDTETGEEDGKPVKPEVTTDCMSAEEAKDPVKQLAGMKEAGAAGQCEKLDVKENGNTVSIVMLCGNAKEFLFNITASYTFHNRRNYTGTMKSAVTMAGKTTTSNKTVVSKWLGACKTPAGKK
jgi:hypothetical protein